MNGDMFCYPPSSDLVLAALSDAKIHLLLVTASHLQRTNSGSFLRPIRIPKWLSIGHGKSPLAGRGDGVNGSAEQRLQKRFRTGYALVEGPVQLSVQGAGEHAGAAYRASPWLFGTRSARTR